jgi:hypothetical protein
VDNDKDLTELRYIPDNALPPDKDPRPQTTEDLISRHKWLSEIHYEGMTVRLNEILADALAVGIPEVEIKEIFSEPLPADDETAKMVLRDRMIGLYTSIDQRKNNLSVSMSRSLDYWKRLLDYDKKIRAFQPKLNEYMVLCRRLNSEDWKYAEWIHTKFEEWVNVPGQDLIKFEEGEGQYITPRLKYQGKRDLDVEKLKELFTRVTKLYQNYQGFAEDLLYKQFPWIRREVEELKNMDRALALFPKIPPEAWDKGQRELKISDIGIEELRKVTGKFRGEVWLNNKLDTLRWKAKSEIIDLARLVSKTGKVGTKAAQAKAVKRKFRGLKPAGENGVDYNEIKAKESHWKDGSAFAVGDTIYTFVKDETKFWTKDVILYLHTKEQIKECYDQLYNEFKWNRLPGDPLVKPTAEDLASEMGLDTRIVGMFLS